MNISKYFWGLNKKSLNQVKIIIKNPKHPNFIPRIVTLLSRCDQPKELFSIIPKIDFIEAWPKIKMHWLKLERESEFRDWWQTIYEGLLRKYKSKESVPKGWPARLFLNIGKILREARIQKGLSQKELSLIIGIEQSDISKIEKGKKNITLGTLSRLCKALGIKKIDM